MAFGEPAKLNKVLQDLPGGKSTVAFFKNLHAATLVLHNEFVVYTFG